MKKTSGGNNLTWTPELSQKMGEALECRIEAILKKQWKGEKRLSDEEQRVLIHDRSLTRAMRVRSMSQRIERLMGRLIRQDEKTFDDYCGTELEFELAVDQLSSAL